MAEVAPPDDGPRPQRRQVVEGRGGGAGACTPLDPVAQADGVAAPAADRVGLPQAPDNVSGPPHDLAFTRWGADSPDGVFENSDERGVGRPPRRLFGARRAGRSAVSWGGSRRWV
jgi:hypothetical protein